MGAASMKLLTTIALTALVATSAMAADVGVYGAPPPAPVYSLYYKWTGCYVGVHVGGLWAHK